MFSIWFARWLPGPFRHRCCRWKQHLKISNQHIQQWVLTFTISKCLHNWPWKHPNSWHMMISKRLIVAAKCFQFVCPGFFRFPGPRASARFQSSICRTHLFGDHETNWDARHHATNIWTLSCQAGKILKYYSIPKMVCAPGGGNRMLRQYFEHVIPIACNCFCELRSALQQLDATEETHRSKCFNRLEIPASGSRSSKTFFFSKTFVTNCNDTSHPFPGGGTFSRF